MATKITLRKNDVFVLFFLASIAFCFIFVLAAFYLPVLGSAKEVLVKVFSAFFTFYQPALPG